MADNHICGSHLWLVGCSLAQLLWREILEHLMQASVHVLWCSTFDDPGIYLNINSYLCKTTVYKVICCSPIWTQLRTRKPRTCLTKGLIKQLTVHRYTGIPCSHRKKHKDVLYELLKTDHFWDKLGRGKQGDKVRGLYSGQRRVKVAEEACDTRGLYVRKSNSGRLQGGKWVVGQSRREILTVNLVSFIFWTMRLQ